MAFCKQRRCQALAARLSSWLWWLIKSSSHCLHLSLSLRLRLRYELHVVWRPFLASLLLENALLPPLHFNDPLRRQVRYRLFTEVATDLRRVESGGSLATFLRRLENRLILEWTCCVLGVQFHKLRWIFCFRTFYWWASVLILRPRSTSRSRKHLTDVGEVFRFRTFRPRSRLVSSSM